MPFLARCPGTVPAKVNETWTSSLDVLPTLVKLCGLDGPAKPIDGVDFSKSLSGGAARTEQKAVLYFSPIGDRNHPHCIRKGDWKLRVAQGMGGEIYTNDSTTYAKENAWLPRPELYNLRSDPEESYDLANQHPEIVKELMADLEKEMETFPEAVRSNYASLKQKVGDVTTPPGAAARPLLKRPLSDWTWVPEDRR